MSTIPNITIPPSSYGKPYNNNIITTPAKLYMKHKGLDTGVIGYYKEGAAVDAYVNGESKKLPFGLDCIADITSKKITSNTDKYSVGNIVEFAAQTVLAADTCLSYLKFLGGKAWAYKLPLGGLLIPLASLFFKSQSVVSSYYKWRNTEDFLSGHHEFTVLLGNVAKCLSYGAQVVAYLALMTIGGTFFFYISILTYLTALYDVIVKECNEEPDHFEQFTTPPSQWVQI